MGFSRRLMNFLFSAMLKLLSSSSLIVENSMSFAAVLGICLSLIFPNQSSVGKLVRRQPSYSLCKHQTLGFPMYYACELLWFIQPFYPFSIQDLIWLFTFSQFFVSFSFSFSEFFFQYTEAKIYCTCIILAKDLLLFLNNSFSSYIYTYTNIYS